LAWVSWVYLNPHPTSDHAVVAKMLNKINNLLKILTGSNICVGTLKTDTYEHRYISIISQNSKKNQRTGQDAQFFALHTVAPHPLNINFSP
jgi:hypothetical protein